MKPEEKKIMKVYLVNREDGGEYAPITTLKAFSTLEKAQAYLVELKEEYKDSISFKRSHFWFDIEEMEVE
jgi:hypothetical protein